MNRLFSTSNPFGNAFAPVNGNGNGNGTGRIRAFVGMRRPGAPAPVFVEGPNRRSLESAVEGFRDSMRSRFGAGFYATRAVVVFGAAKKALEAPGCSNLLMTAAAKIREANIVSVLIFDGEDTVPVYVEQPHPQAQLPPFSSLQLRASK